MEHTHVNPKAIHQLARIEGHRRLEDSLNHSRDGDEHTHDDLPVHSH